MLQDRKKKEIKMAYNAGIYFYFSNQNITGAMWSFIGNISRADCIMIPAMELINIVRVKVHAKHVCVLDCD